MSPLAKLNPQTVQAGGNIATVAIGAPALIYVGVRYAPSIKSKVFFAALGGAILWANAEGLKAAYNSRKKA